MTENPSQDTAQLPELFQDQVAAVADAANAKALVSMSPVQIKLSRKRPPEDINTSMMDLTQAKRDARDVKNAIINVLKEAVLSKPAENPISPPTPPNDSAGRSKSAEGTNISNCWLELYKELDGPDRPVSLPEIQKGKRRVMFPIINNINNKDITDDESEKGSVRGAGRQRGPQGGQRYRMGR